MKDRDWDCEASKLMVIEASLTTTVWKHAHVGSTWSNMRPIAAERMPHRAFTLLKALRIKPTKTENIAALEAVTADENNIKRRHQWKYAHSPEWAALYEAIKRLDLCTTTQSNKSSDASPQE